MNKKFSTLVATLLLSGALFTVSAAEISLGNFAEQDGIEYASGKMTFTKDVTIDNYKDYLLISEDNVVVDGQDNTLKGRIVVTGKNVTIKNLVIDYKNEFPENEDGTITVNKTALTVISSSATIINNKIICSSVHWLANAISVFPTSADATFTIEGNRIENANAEVGGWSASGIQVVEGYDLKNTGLAGQTAKSPAIKDFDAKKALANNTFVNVATDYSQTDWSTDTSNGDIKAVQVTPIVKDGNIQNAGAIKNAVKNTNEGVVVNFKGTVEQLQEVLSTETDLPVIPILTNDGMMVSSNIAWGADVLNAKGSKLLLTTGLSDEKVYTTEDYFLLVRHSEWGSGSKGDFAVTSAEEGKIGQIEIKAGMSDADFKALAGDDALWKMRQEVGDDDRYTFTFVNKKGVKLAAGDSTYFYSLGNQPYGAKGVILGLDGYNTSVTNDNKYYALYRAATQKLTVNELNWYQKEGFFVSFDLKKDQVLAGDDAFAGLLKATPVGSGDGNSTEFSLMNEDGKYIVAKTLQTNGTKKNNWTYGFELIGKKAYEADQAKAVKDRQYFNLFSFYYNPKSADDDLQAIEKIDSIKVQVPNDKGALTEALVGWYELEGENTLAASIAYGLNPVKINMSDNVVVPEEFLKDQKGYAIIKNVETGEYFAANDCKGAGMEEKYGNPLEIQWAVSYDADKKEYTLTNRENTAIKTEAIPYKQLRENDNKEDNIYVYGGKEYEITFHEADASSNYYKYLGNVKNQTFVIGHWSGVYNANAWFTADKDSSVLVNTDKEKALEIKAINNGGTDNACDTVKVKTTVSWYGYNADKKKDMWQTKDYTLEVPVYQFFLKDYRKNDLKFGLQEGTKYAFGEIADSLVIRKDGDHWNLRVASKAEDEKSAIMTCSKIYASTSAAEAGYLKLMNSLYTETTNDLFDVEEKDRPEYRRLGATVEDGFTSKIDTAKFFRTNEVTGLYLYENTSNRNTQGAKPSLNFLGEVQSDYLPENVQLPFVVDTAFVRNNTPKPLYLLAVRTTVVEPQEDTPCEVPGHGMDCEHAIKGHEGYRTGDYLVCLDDSLDIEGLNVEFNEYTRLAFVPAKHIGDTLQITRSKWTNSKDEDEVAKDSIFFSETKKGVVSQKDINAAAFAFRLVDPKAAKEEGMADFYIENTNYVDGEELVRYVHVLNSVPVLVEDLHQASTFNVEAAAEGETPTANEGIATSEVSVIASDGAVIVKGAAGKNVVITNVLGQTVANTVVTSDEATIAAPAGVVVVSVEGEAAVKAIVK